jgi:hypothetical protein
LKIPLVGTLGLNTNTAILVGLAGVATFMIMHKYGSNLDGLGAPSEPEHDVMTRYDPDNDDDDDSGEFAQENDDGIKQRMGWTVPTEDSEDYGEITRRMRQGWPLADNRAQTDFEIPHIKVGGIPIYHTNNFLRVSDDSYDAGDDDMRGDGFSGAYSVRSYDASVVDPNSGATQPTTTNSSSTTTGGAGCVQTQMCPTTSYWDPQVCACVPMSTGQIGTVGGTTNAAVTDLQNRILREIISRTSNVATVLGSIDTIKAAIATYGIKLQLAVQQQQAGVINDIQMSQYLSQIATDIGTQLQITLNPVTDASSLPGYGTNYQGYGSYGGSVYPYGTYGSTGALGSYPYSTGNNGAVPPYYQQYGQNYQDYVNQLNSNYYQYYQPSYQYFPGQNYNYYQPYQYQYPNPYYPQGQYPTTYPSYSTPVGYGYGYGYNSGYGYNPYSYPGYGYATTPVVDYDDYNSGGGGLLGGIGNMVSGILGSVGI